MTAAVRPGPGSPQKLDALTGIRFFAAFLVVCFHVGVSPIGKVSAPAAQIAMKGHAAVGLFYVLSGFVLAYNYLDRRVSYKDFLLARFARIYPVYFLALLLSLPAWALHTRQEHDFFNLALSFVTVPTLIQAWWPGTALLWNAPAWSLSVEAFFYCMFPLVLVAFRNASARRLRVTVAAAVATTFAINIVYLLGQHAPWRDLANRPPDVWTRLETTSALGVVNFNPLLRFPEFVAGVALGALFLKRGAQALGGVAWLPDVLASGVLVLSLSIAALPQFVPYPILHNALFLPLWCLLVYSLAGSRILCRALGCGWLIVLGEISYGMYILQQPVSQWFKLFMLKVGHLTIQGDYPDLGMFLTYSVVLTVASYASYKWLETPLRRVIRRHKPRATIRRIPTLADAAR